MSAAIKTQAQRVIAVVAHPDDEVLGCGGALARHASAGDEVLIVVMADGETSRDPNVDADDVSRREAAARRAAAILGVRHVALHRLPDNRLDTMARLDVIKLVEKHLRDFGPATVYTHHAGDLNVDHRRVHEAVVTACRPQAGHPVKRILFL